MKILKRVSAVIIFLLAVFFGAQVTDSHGVWGNVGIFGTFIIIAISFFFMWGAIALWKSTRKKE